MCKNNTIEKQHHVDIVYARLVGDIIVLVAKYWVICKGTRIVRNSNIKNMEVESDIQVTRAINAEMQ